MLTAELFAQHGIRVSDETVAKLLREHGYSLQAPSKSVEGKQHPDCDAQFKHIKAKAKDCIERGVPVISVDTRKELVGNFKNGGREWQTEREPELVDEHAFPSTAVGKAMPYETAAPAWRRRVDLLTIHVSHFPPSTSKWNQVQHCLFYFISINWRGRPLRTYETIIISWETRQTDAASSCAPAATGATTRPAQLRDRQEGVRQLKIERDTSMVTKIRRSDRARSPADRLTSSFAGP